MRLRNARVVAAAQSCERLVIALFALFITLIVAIALVLGPAMAAGSGPPGGPTGGTTRLSNDGSPQCRDTDKPAKHEATTSDEHEDAVELIEDQKYQEAIAKLNEANANIREAPTFSTTSVIAIVSSIRTTRR
jgi:hypothetical protein